MMAARLCSSTKSDGSPCRAVALSGSTLCRAHRTIARRSRQLERCARSAVDRGRYIRLSPMATRSSIQRTLDRVLQLLFAETLSLHRASRYLHRVQLASTALRQRERNERHLPSPIPPPTINQVPAIRRSSQPAVNQPTNPNAERRTGAPEREQHT